MTAMIHLYSFGIFIFLKVTFGLPEVDAFLTDIHYSSSKTKCFQVPSQYT